MAFVLFFTIFTVIYLLMQAYMVQKVWRAFPEFGRWRWLLVAWGLLMAAAIWLGGAFRDRSWASVLGPVMDISYCWLVVSFWFLLGGLAADLWNVLMRPAALATPAAKKLRVGSRSVVIVLTVLSMVGVGWGLYEAMNVRATQVVIRGVGPLSRGRSHLRIVQISDVHLTGYTRTEGTAALVEFVRRQQPDIVIATGDMIDAPAERLAAHARLLRQLTPPMGKYAVTGNHEHYTGISEAETFHRDAGFDLLRQQSVRVCPGVRLAGVDDHQPFRGERSDPVAAEAAALADATTDEFVVLLKHQPLVQAASLGVVDLQVSGHTHGGQVFPFWVFGRMRYRYMHGRYDLGKGTTLWVSRGTGTWGPPLRVGAPPEITVIDLVAE